MLATMKAAVFAGMAASQRTCPRSERLPTRFRFRWSEECIAGTMRHGDAALTRAIWANRNRPVSSQTSILHQRHTSRQSHDALRAILRWRVDGDEAIGDREAALSSVKLRTERGHLGDDAVRTLRHSQDRGHKRPNSRRASQMPGSIGSQNVSPRSRSVAASAASMGTPRKLSMPTEPASKVPRPTGIGPVVATIEAMVKLTKTTQIAGTAPMALNASQSVSASSMKIPSYELLFGRATPGCAEDPSAPQQAPGTKLSCRAICSATRLAVDRPTASGRRQQSGSLQQ